MKYSNIFIFLIVGSGKLLTAVNVTRQRDLTPKATFLYQQARYFKQKAASIARSKLSFKQRLAAATKMSNDEAFVKATSTMDKVRSRFFKNQIECSGKKPRGCRFTVEDKILALSFYKQSGSSYKYLSKFFAFPSRATLLKLCNQITIKPDFNQCIFDVLKAEATNFKNALDKYCILLFDEMSIAPNLSWNGNCNIVHGFCRVHAIGCRISSLVGHKIWCF